MYPDRLSRDKLGWGVFSRTRRFSHMLSNPNKYFQAVLGPSDPEISKTWTIASLPRGYKVKSVSNHVTWVDSRQQWLATRARKGRVWLASASDRISTPKASSDWGQSQKSVPEFHLLIEEDGVVIFLEGVSLIVALQDNHSYRATNLENSLWKISRARSGAWISSELCPGQSGGVRRRKFSWANYFCHKASPKLSRDCWRAPDFDFFFYLAPNGLLMDHQFWQASWF